MEFISARWCAESAVWEVETGLWAVTESSLSEEKGSVLTSSDITPEMRFTTTVKVCAPSGLDTGLSCVETVELGRQKGRRVPDIFIVGVSCKRGPI